MKPSSSRLTIIFRPWPIRPLPVSILLTLFQLLLNSVVVISSARSQGRLADLRELWAVMPSVVLGLIFSFLVLAALKNLIARFGQFEALIYWLGAVVFGLCLAFARILAINDLTPAFWKDPIGWWRIFAVSIFIYLLVHISLGTANQKLAEQVLRAEAANAALEIQRGRLISAGEDVRRQIADFLHDRLQSDLVLLGMQMQRSMEKLSQEDQGVARAYIDEIERIRQFDVRGVSRQLAPELDGPSLKPALEELLSRYEKIFPTKLEILESGSMPRATKLACYRIIEQAMLNAARHGKAKSVTVGVLERESLVELKVRNTGAPLPEKLTPGAGFAIFDDWTAQHQGQWSIKSDSTGTELSATLHF